MYNEWIDFGFTLLDCLNVSGGYALATRMAMAIL